MTVASPVFGTIKGYSVVILGNTVQVINPERDMDFWHEVPNYGTHINELALREGFALGWASLGQGECEVLYFYDKNDDNFGYALNVDWEDCSEWGYSPFEVAPKEAKSDTRLVKVEAGVYTVLVGGEEVGTVRKWPIGSMWAYQLAGSSQWVGIKNQRGGSSRKLAVRGLIERA